MSQQTYFFPLEGGLDLITPAITAEPGALIAGVNYEPVARGYKRIGGFERRDGHPKPSEASYWVLHFDAGVAAVTVGQTITGLTSGATGYVLVDAVVTSGSYGGGNAVGYVVITNMTGVFVDNEAVQVAAVTKFTANGVAVERGASNDTDDTTWIRAAVAYRRTLIVAVPGGGVLRGVWMFGGVIYAFRDNAAVGATSCRLYKSSAAGWVLVPYGKRIGFTAGTAALTEGATVTGGTSGATAVIRRVVKRTGAWSGTAAGYLIVDTDVGTFQAAEIITGGGGSATCSGAATAVAMLPGGRYEFVTHNFYGATNLRRVYGCDGVNKAFEFDGTTLVPIETGMAIDTPRHIQEHKNHLFLSFLGGSAQFSGIGEPLVFTVISGAGEIGLGEEITAFQSSTSGVMAILGLNKIALLYGTGSSSWQLVRLSDDSGAKEWTVQLIGAPTYLDDRGLRSMDTTQAFGDFSLGTLTRQIEPLIQRILAAGVTPVASMRVRSKDQYRLFWSDGTGLTVYLGRKKNSIVPFDLGMVVSCCCSVEEPSGMEALLFGSSSGHVYQLDSGQNFDGEQVVAYVRLPFSHFGSPTTNKRYHKATLEVDATALNVINMLAEFSYGDASQPATDDQAFNVRGGGGFWNEDFWNEFYWSSPVEGKASCHFDGLGQNISIAIISTSTYEDPHTLHGLTIHYSPRGLVR